MSGHDTGTHCLLVRLGDEFYGLPGMAVREVIRYRPPVPVPGAPPTLPGLLNQRGIILTVVDLRPLLGLAAVAPARSSRYVYVHHGEVDLALIADGVIDLVVFGTEQNEALPANLDPLRARLLQGMARHDGLLVAILDLDALVRALREEP